MLYPRPAMPISVSGLARVLPRVLPMVEGLSALVNDCAKPPWPGAAVAGFAPDAATPGAPVSPNDHTLGVPAPEAAAGSVARSPPPKDHTAGSAPAPALAEPKLGSGAAEETSPVSPVLRAKLPGAYPPG